MTIIAGLDVGGAHLKVAVVDDGSTAQALQLPCPLWRGMEHLDHAIAAAEPVLGDADRIAITMTGELSDLFPDRQTGVAALVSRLEHHLGGRTTYWMGPSGFGTAKAARNNSNAVGSMNYLATAEWIARQQKSALLIDFGSTTADIIAVRDQKPLVSGLTDGERQISGELVYTGLTRTAVMAVADRAPFKGHWHTLAREHLATMADVRRILGELKESVDLHSTADGRSKSVADSIARFARMFGRDAKEGTIEDWRYAAAYVRDIQTRSIEDGCWQVLSKASLSSESPVITAGIGADAAKAIALRLGRTAIEFGNLALATADCVDDATANAPAVAVALLLTASP